MTESKKALASLSVKIPENLKYALEKKSKAASTTISSIVIEALTAYITNSNATYTDEKILISARKIRLLLMAQNPDISMLEKEVSILLWLLQENNIQS